MTDKIHHAMKTYIGYRTSDPDQIAKQPENVIQLDAWLASEVQMSEARLNERFESEALVPFWEDQHGVYSYRSIGDSPVAVDSCLTSHMVLIGPVPVLQFARTHLFSISTITGCLIQDAQMIWCQCLRSPKLTAGM